MIAMALSCNPDLLIADEPTTALDVTIQAQILALVRKLRTDFGSAIVLITHDLGVVADVADRVCVMYAGRIVEDGPKGELVRQRAAPVHLGAARLDPPHRPAAAAPPDDDPRPAAVAAPDAAGLQLRAPLPARVRALLGRAARARGPRGTRAPRPLLSAGRREARAARDDDPSRSCRHERRGAARGARGRSSTSRSRAPASCAARSGQCAGGRRRLLRGARGRDARPRRRVGLRQVDARALPAFACTTLTAGSVVFDGRDISQLDRRALRPLRREMQMVFQDPVRVAQPAQARRRDHRRAARHPRAVARRRRRRRVQELMDVVGLAPEHYNRYPHEFSGGQRQRIGVARALALQSAADRRRRARLGARRLDPGADRQPARRPAGRVRADLPLHRARPRRRAPRLRPHRGHVPRQDRRALAGRGALRAAHPPLHGGAALGGADPRPAGASASASCSRATCRARSTRRAAAASTRAAATRPRSARSKSRR